MKNYIFVGLHEKESDNRLHLRNFARGIYKLVVIKTIKEAEEFLDRLADKEIRDYHFLLNMNVLRIEEVNSSGLLKRFDPRRITLSYHHTLTFAPVPVKEEIR